MKDLFRAKRSNDWEGDVDSGGYESVWLILEAMDGDLVDLSDCRLEECTRIASAVSESAPLDLIIGRIQKNLPISQIKSIVFQLVLGLSHIVEIGVVHRDIKPQNVLCRRDTASDVMLQMFHDVSILSHG